jgi:hypothetical protein
MPAYQRNSGLTVCVWVSSAVSRALLAGPMAGSMPGRALNTCTPVQRMPTVQQRLEPLLQLELGTGPLVGRDVTTDFHLRQEGEHVANTLGDGTVLVQPANRAGNVVPVFKRCRAVSCCRF